MKCSKCKEYGWKDPQPVVFIDPQNGMRYCQFHAPVKEKTISVGSFNKKVFKRIQAAIDSGDAGTVCNLSGTVFPGDISFSKYGKESSLPDISFSFALFNSKVNFSGVSFRGKVDFSEAVFRQTVLFNKADFNVSVHFVKTWFNGLTSFYSAIFNGFAFFSYAIFCRETSFSLASFNHAIFYASAIEDSMDFNRIQVAPPGIQFVKIDLYHLMFFNVDLKDLEFANSCWPIANEEYLIPLNWGNGSFVSCLKKWLRGGFWDRYRIVSEKENEPKWHQICEFYQRMKRKNKEDHNEYEVSKWHISEKEAQLKLLRQSGESKLLCFALWLYKQVSGFGEGPRRAGMVLLILIGIAWLLLGMGGLSNGGYSIQGPAWPTWESTRNFGTVFMVLFEYVMMLKDTSTGFKPQYGWIEGVMLVLTRLVIPLQAALFGFAVRNTFRR